MQYQTPITDIVEQLWAMSRLVTAGTMSRLVTTVNWYSAGTYITGTVVQKQEHSPKSIAHDILYKSSFLTARCNAECEREIRTKVPK